MPADYYGKYSFVHIRVRGLLARLGQYYVWLSFVESLADIQVCLEESFVILVSNGKSVCLGCFGTADVIDIANDVSRMFAL